MDVRADREQIREVLNNLVENAIKFTSRGSISISIGYDDDFAKVCIADTGFGISENGQKHLFEKFYQVDNTATREVSGTGLGLYIARQIVDAHKGKVWAESDGEGLGSRFFVKLPKIQPAITQSATEQLAK